MEQPLFHIVLAAVCLSLGASTALAQDNKPAESADKAAADDDIHVIKGNPPSDQPFGRIRLGMKFAEAVDILGKPTSERSYCTGKHRIPFYYGRDRAYTEYYYKGQGKVYFYTEFSSISAFHGAVKTCTPTTPFELAGVEFNPAESGEAPPL